MPREDDAPMDTGPTFDAIIDRIRARDRTPGPDARFVHALGSRLAATQTNGRRTAMQVSHVAPRRTSRLSGRAAGAGLRWAGVAATLALLLGAVVGTVGDGVGWPGRHKTTPSVLAPVVAQTASTPTSGNDDASARLESACTTDPRAPGSVDTVLASGPGGIAILPSYGKGGVLDSAFFEDRYPALDDPSDVAGLKATLEQLWACRMYARDLNGDLNTEGRYVALYTDDALRRAYADLPGGLPTGAAQPLDFLQPAMFDRYTGPPELVAPFVVESTGVRKVGGYIAPPPRCFEREMQAQFGTLMIFARVGDAWLVDQVAPATRNEGPFAGPPVSPEHLDLVLFDASDTGPDGIYGNYRTVSCNSSFYAETDLRVTVHNAGARPYRLVITALDIDLALPPNTSTTMLVNAPPGPLTVTVYEDDVIPPTATFEIQFVRQGENRPGG